MSKELDAKLRDILSQQYDIVGEMSTIRFNHDDVLAQIHQAFAEAGYLKHPLGIDPLHGEHDSRLKTGAEWFDRFEKELGNYVGHGELVAWQEEMLGIAKRAAGLE